VCGECSIAAVSGAGRVRADDPKMICGACNQARDVREDILIIIASPGLVGRSGSVAEGPSILKVNSGAQAVRIYGAVKPG
jgi:hypothetical protein